MTEKQQQRIGRYYGMLVKIVDQLKGIAVTDLTTAEQNIIRIMVTNGFAQINEEKQCVELAPRERKQK